MMTADGLLAAMRDATDRDPAADAFMGQLAAALARVANGEITADQAAAVVKAAGPALRELDGKTVEHGGKVLDFSQAIAGKIEVGDVAGGSIVKVTINYGPPLNIGERSRNFEAELLLVGSLATDHLASLVDIAKQTLAIDLPDGIDPGHVIARALMQATIPQLSDFAGLMALLDCQKALAVIDIAGPFCWIKPEAAAQIPVIASRPPGQRGLSINAALPTTAHQYLACAPMRPGTIRVGLSGRNSDGLLEDIVAEIYEVLAGPLKCSVEQCPTKVTQTTRTLFVVLPGEPPDADLLEQLRDRFSNVVFVVLAGDRSREGFDELHLPYVDYLVPALEPGQEAQASAGLDEAREILPCST